MFVFTQGVLAVISLIEDVVGADLSEAPEGYESGLPLCYICRCPVGCEVCPPVIG